MPDCIKAYRVSWLILIVVLAGLGTPSVLTVWMLLSGQSTDPAMVVLLLLLWLMMLAAGIPLLLLWHRAFVRIFEDHIEFRGIGSARSVRFDDVRTIKREPDKLLLIGHDRRPLGYISITIARFGDLEREITERIHHTDL